MLVPYKLHSALCCLTLVLIMTPQSHAFQAAPGAPRGQKIDDLSAYLAFCAVVTKYSYALPDEKVRAVVLKSLQDDANPPPKKMPTVERLQGALDVDFEASWTEMINKAAEGLDPTGQQDIASRLRTLVETRPVRAEAKAKHADLLKEGLPNALDREKKRLTEEQTKQLVDQLKQFVTPEMPGQQRVVDAQANDRAAATKVLVDQTMQKLPPELLSVVIQESYDGLSAAADNVVADGVTQLDAQLEVLAKTPDAVSQGAVKTEIESRLQELAQGQKAQREGDPLRPSYGVFTRVSQQVSNKAREWFDWRVADAGKQVLLQVAGGKRGPSDEDKETLRKLILADLPAHHEPTTSLRLAAPAIANIVGRSQQWIVGDLVKDLQESQSPDDKSCAPDRFRQDVVDIMNAGGTQSNGAWTTLKNALERRYVNELLPAVREKIADEQARKYASGLMSGNWIPTESELDTSKSELEGTQQERHRRALMGLKVWDNSPPRQQTDVLSETWDQWLRAAKDALEITRQAREGQLSIVRDLTPTIREGISKDPEPTLDKWVTEFSRVTAQEWATRQPGIATKYPKLFETTTAQIIAAVTELLPLAEQERSKNEPTAGEKAEASPPQTVPATPVMSQPNPEQPPQPKTPPAQDSATNQAGAGQAESQGEMDGAGKSEAAGGGDGEDGKGTKKEGPTDEEQKPEEGKGEDDGVGPGEGDGEGDGEPEAAQGVAGDATRVPAPNGQIPPAQPSWADLLYRILIWILLALMILMAVCWYCHVRYLRRLLAQYRRPVTLNV